MNNTITRKNELIRGINQIRILVEKGEIEKANSLLRNTSFVADKLGVFIGACFSEIQLPIQTPKRLTTNCAYCDFTTERGRRSLEAHIGRKHKGFVYKEDL